MRNFNEIFRENVLMIILNQGFTLSLQNTFLEKPQGGSNWPPAFLGLIVHSKIIYPVWNFKSMWQKLSMQKLIAQFPGYKLFNWLQIYELLYNEDALVTENWPAGLWLFFLGLQMCLYLFYLENATQISWNILLFI